MISLQAIAMQGDMSVSLPPDLFLESDLSKLQEDE
jgi:hypothetical protein